MWTWYEHGTDMTIEASMCAVDLHQNRLINNIRSTWVHHNRTNWEDDNIKKTQHGVRCKNSRGCQECLQKMHWAFSYCSLPPSIWTVLVHHRLVFLKWSSPQWHGEFRHPVITQLPLVRTCGHVDMVRAWYGHDHWGVDVRSSYTGEITTTEKI